ncbi:hypothetical protein [Synechococcus elongatus]|uniref:hypothetical protein n=1 Tax=Synechococcus elongatus TaxID=32046 RepID=UPI000F7E8252|nr:hypothetical protein [Synechococcus elongatus]
MKGKRNHEDANFNYLKEEWEASATCIHESHRISRFDRRAWRTVEHKACIRCLAKISEGRCSFDINEITKSFRDLALDFWSLVDIKDPDECWKWHGEKNKSGRGIVRWKRPFSFTNIIPAARASFWLAWGDIGTSFSVSRECGNPNCVNPLHLRGVGCGHLLMPESMEKFNLFFSARRLRFQTFAHREEHEERLRAIARKPLVIKEKSDLWIGDGTVEGLDD